MISELVTDDARYVVEGSRRHKFYESLRSKHYDGLRQYERTYETSPWWRKLFMADPYRVAFYYPPSSTPQSSLVSEISKVEENGDMVLVLLTDFTIVVPSTRVKTVTYE